MFFYFFIFLGGFFFSFVVVVVVVCLFVCLFLGLLETRGGRTIGTRTSGAVG